MKRLLPWFFSAAVLAPSLASGQVIVNDNWADGGRNNGADPLDADWWTSSSSSGIEVSTGSLGLVTGTSGRGIHGTFAPQTLAVGQLLRATFTFTTPATIGAVSSSGPIRVGLMEFNNPGLAANLSASSTSPQPLYIGLPGYMMDFDFLTGATADTSFRKHSLTSTLGRLLSTTSEWDQLGTGPDSGYSFAPATTYVGVFSAARTGDSTMQLSGSLSQGATLLTSYTYEDSGAIPGNIGMLAFHVNSGIFGSSPTPDTADNGIDFSNITIEVAVIPEPSSGVLLLGGLVLLGRSLRRKP